MEQVVSQASMKVYSSMSAMLADIVHQALQQGVQNMDPKDVKINQDLDGSLSFSEVKKEA